MSEILDLARSAAEDAGRILLGQLGGLDASEIRSKSAERDLVTSADLASERLIVERIRARFPDHAIVAEEEVRDGGAADRGPRWYIDPLDGTVNFVHRIPAFSVSLGLYVDGVPEVAVVHAPRLGETFTAVRGRGAHLGDARLSVSSATRLADCVLATGFPYRRHELPNNNLENFNSMFLEVRGLRRLGSAALDLAYTAAGRFDGFWELHLGSHDVAAGALLVREAGGIVTDLAGGDAWLDEGHILAAGEAVHALVRSRVRL